MAQAHEFETQVSWTEKRQGRIEAPDLPSLDIASPPAFGGPGSTWTPEHFFVTSANACVMLTFVAIAELSKLEFRSFSSRAKGKVEKIEGEGFRFTGIEIQASLEVTKASDVERAERILKKAESACLVSASMKTPVRVTGEIRASES